MTQATSELTVGTEIPVFQRATGLQNWNRYAAVNDEFVDIHMDDDAGRAAGFPTAFGMGNLQWSYLHTMLRDWIGDDGPDRAAALPVPVAQHQEPGGLGARQDHRHPR